MTQDELKLFDLKIRQPRNGYRYSLDPLLLARFCEKTPANAKIIDLGAGCGIISLVMARLHLDSKVVALEKNRQMVELIKENIELNNLSDQVLSQSADLLEYRSIYSDSTFDLVISNPPYRTPQSGRTSPKAGRDAARHETTATLSDFLSAAKYLVKPSGRICMIHLPARFVEFVSLANSIKLSILRIRMIHNNLESPATMFMVELAKGRKSSPIIEKPLFVRDMDGNYTDEVWR